MTGPVTIDITITNADGQVATATAVFTFTPPVVPAPIIASVSPASGDVAGGTVVTITGQNFQAGATVDFGGRPATDVVVNEDGTTITCTSPSFE